MYASSRLVRLFCVVMLLLPASARADAETYMRLSTHIVKVLAAGTDGRMNTGTGVQVAPTVVATNCHVAGNARSVVASRGSMGREAQSVRGDGTRDVCLLHLGGEMAAPVDTAPLPQMDDPVYAMGFSGGQVLSVSEGVVLGLREVEGGYVIETDAAFQMGASGGGLFDAQGRLLGLLTFYSPDQRGGYFVVPARWIEEAMHMAESDPAVTKAQPFWVGLNATQLKALGTPVAATRKPR